MAKLAEASVQLNELNEKLAVQKVAVTEKTEACEALLGEISVRTSKATEKKQAAEGKSKEIEEQSIVIASEKVGQDSEFNHYSSFHKSRVKSPNLIC